MTKKKTKIKKGKIRINQKLMKRYLRNYWVISKKEVTKIVISIIKALIY
jgi:hypothetical protein